MKRSHKLIVAAVLLVSAIVAGAAIGATKVLSPKQESDAIIEDAAGQLGVTPQRLSKALKQALKNRVDEAVSDGRLTKEEGAKLKGRVDAGARARPGLPRSHGGSLSHQVRGCCRLSRDDRGAAPGSAGERQDARP